MAEEDGETTVESTSEPSEVQGDTDQRGAAPESTSEPQPVEGDRATKAQDQALTAEPEAVPHDIVDFGGKARTKDGLPGNREGK